MSESNESRIPRRSFLVGAAGMVGGAMVGLSPTTALARALRGQASPPTVAFLQGGRLIAPQYLTGSYNPLDVAVLSIRGFGGVGSIKSIDVNFNVEVGTETEVAPFHAWTASNSTPMPMVRFTAPIDVVKGLSLIVFQGAAQTNPTTIQLGGAAKAQLREGTYVIAGSGINLATFSYSEENKTAPLSPMLQTGQPLSYVIMQVAAS